MLTEIAVLFMFSLRYMSIFYVRIYICVCVFAYFQSILWALGTLGEK